MTLNATQAKHLECVLVSTILDNPTAKWGPNVCTCLAYAPEFWDSVEARIVAHAICRVLKEGRPTHPVVIKRTLSMLSREYADWVDHPMFKDALPPSCIEHEVFPLIERYHSKRIVATIAQAYEKLIDKPELAKEVGRELVVKLEGVL